MGVKSEKLRRNMYYTDGNAVRKLDIPLEYPAYDEPSRKKENRQKRIKERTRAERLDMSLGYTCFVILMVVTIVISCVKYLDLTSTSRENSSRISTLKSQLDTLVTKNDAMDYEINGFVDVQYVMDKAMNELGMVVASKKQVRFYDSSVSEYMNQLNDVPQGE